MENISQQFLIETQFGLVTLYENIFDDGYVFLTDSDGRFFYNVCSMEYLHWLSVKNNDTEYDELKKIAQQIGNINSLFDLNDDIEFVGTKDEMIKYLNEELNWDLPNENYNPLDNEYINKVGNYYILMKD